MTADPNPPGRKSIAYLVALVPVLAFGGTFAGMALWNAGVRFDFQYAAIGGFLGSCLLAYLAWTRPARDIVALSTPIYGFIFLASPVDYDSGVLLQLIYACGLTVLAARFRHRFDKAGPVPSSTELAAGPLKDFIESSRDAFTGLMPAAGHRAADAFIQFSGGEYRRAADISHAAVCCDGTPGHVLRAFSILRQHAELLDRNQPRPVTYLKFLPEDAPLMAKSLPSGDNPELEFEATMDNALLLLYSAAWHGSPEDRPALLVSQGFARKLLES
jgi:hypothetical protein